LEGRLVVLQLVVSMRGLNGDAVGDHRARPQPRRSDRQALVSARAVSRWAGKSGSYMDQASPF
jgi:hypothetical protein